MNIHISTNLNLIEQEPAFFSDQTLSRDLESWLNERYGKILEIVPPAAQTGGRWRLLSRGWIGQIPLPDGRLLVLNPKVPIGNVFAMLSFVYDLFPLRMLDSTFKGKAMADFYDFLARQLLDGIYRRRQRGIYRAYEMRRGHTQAVRGRLDLAEMNRQPAGAYPMCEYQEHTADNPHNQLLAWTLDRMGTASFSEVTIAQQARLLGRRFPVTLHPFSPSDAAGLAYNRLNEDYRPLHRLCRFFLEQIGPTHHHGQRPLTPFIMSMPDLFERFVGRWIRQHLPAGWRIVEQAPIEINLQRGRPRRLAADLVLIDPRGQAMAVADCKYKNGSEPEMADIYQVTFYAHELGCSSAFLIYPFTDSDRMVAGVNNGVAYSSIVFDLNRDLNAAGRRVIEALRPLPR